jgi:hypothetical protein
MHTAATIAAHLHSSKVIDQVINWFYFISGIKSAESQFSYCNNHHTSNQTSDGFLTTFCVDTLLLEQKFGGSRALCQAVFTEFLNDVIRVTYPSETAYEQRKFVGRIDFEKNGVELLVRTPALHMKPYLNHRSVDLKEKLIQAVFSKIETSLELAKRDREELTSRIAAMEEILKIKQKP